MAPTLTLRKKHTRKCHYCCDAAFQREIPDKQDKASTGVTPARLQKRQILAIVVLDQDDLVWH
jgi:hypothetical protein